MCFTFVYRQSIEYLSGGFLSSFKKKKLHMNICPKCLKF